MNTVTLENSIQVPKIAEISLPFDPHILLLGIAWKKKKKERKSAAGQSLSCNRYARLLSRGQF